MTVTLLRGATAVRAIVAEYLESTVPTTVALARANWGLDDVQLPLPVAYDAYEPYALDKWPLIGVTVAQAGQFNKVNFYPDMSQQYLTEYTVRVYTWVRTPVDEDGIPLEPEYSESIRLRDDLAACVRASLLASGGLGRTDVWFDESSLSEEYSETDPVKGNRFVGGVIHSFTIRYNEAVPFEGIGTADSIIIDVDTHNPDSSHQRFTASITAAGNVS
jgi:hypothetical protein